MNNQKKLWFAVIIVLDFISGAILYKTPSPHAANVLWTLLCIFLTATILITYSVQVWGDK